MFVEFIVIAWSGAGLLWWVLSWWLVGTSCKTAHGAALPREKKTLTVFKPLPLLGSRGLELEARGLESFICQLDGESELLLGVHEVDRPKVLPFVERMQAAYPAARIVVVGRSDADTVANPKIAWQRVLAPRATGQLWLWSDADIVAGPGFLDQARAEFETCGAELLTFPYAVRTLPHPPAVLDALFVNTEFYPGVMLLRRFGSVDFGLGAALLFSRETFLRKVDWEKLGSSLADDFILGQLLKPVCLGSITLETVADATDWSAAFAHYYRWKKTICWCRPGGFAAQAMVMPILGWLVLVALHPGAFYAWAGLVGMIEADVFFAAMISRNIGCPLTAFDLLAAQIWSPSRVFFWIVCWLPGPVKWRDKSWRHLHQPLPSLPKEIT
jgi:ceramide glucosyltransferase